MANINQTLLIRTDLFSLPEDTGLLAAQVAHIHFQVSRDMLLEGLDDDGKAMIILDEKGEQGEQGSDYEEWLKDPYLLVKRVPNLEALQYFREEANLSELPVAEWRDTVNVRLSATVKKAFEDVLVGISIGPCDSDKIRTVVGDIPLL